MATWCVTPPTHHDGRVNGYCEKCLAEIIAEIRKSPSPLAAVDRFAAAAARDAEVVSGTLRPHHWWNRRWRVIRFSAAVTSASANRTRREVAAMVAYAEHRALVRGFPSFESFQRYRAESWGLPRPIYSGIDYYNVLAAWTGYPRPYCLRPDPETIALLENHRDEIAPSIPAEILYIVGRHALEQDCNSPRIVRADKQAELARWIMNAGALPRAVVTYRQETRAHGTYGVHGSAAWWKRLAALAPAMNSVGTTDQSLHHSIPPTPGSAAPAGMTARNGPTTKQPSTSRSPQPVATTWAPRSRPGTTSTN